MADVNKPTRGSNFTGGELNQLCASWMHVSQDPIVGNAQKNGAFWDRTLLHYNENRPREKEKRNVRSLKTKWHELKRDIAKYSGCFSAVVDAHHSGENEEDTVRRAKELYVTKDPKGKEFMYLDQWTILKDCPRFAMTMGDLRQRAAQLKGRKPKGKGRPSAECVDSPQQEGVIDNARDENQVNDDTRRQSLPHSQENDRESLHFGEQRPISNKAAKRQRGDENSTRLMAYAQRDMAEISAKRLKLAESHLKLAESQERQNLFLIRVADLDPECQEYFRASRAKELKIAMLKLQREEEEEERALRSIRTPLPVPTASQNTTDMQEDATPSAPDINVPNLECHFEGSHNLFAQDENNHIGSHGSFSAQLAEARRAGFQDLE